MWISCPKLSLATFMGAQALTGEFKELRVLCEMAGMPIPTGSHSQRLQKEKQWVLQTDVVPGRWTQEEELPPSCPPILEPRSVPSQGSKRGFIRLR